MKKTWFLAVLFALGTVNFAYAKCMLNACDSFRWYEPNASVQAQVNGHQCWGCGPGPKSCGGGDVVPVVDEESEIISLYQCTLGLTNSFEKFNPGNFCDDSPIRNVSASNAKTIYKEIGQETTKTKIGDVDYFEGSAFCKYIYCKKDYMPNNDKTDCVADTRNSKCWTSDGETHPNGYVFSSDCITANNASSVVGKLHNVEHIKSGAKCVLTCVENGWDITLNNDSCETKYEPNSPKKKCVKTQAAINDDNARNAAARRNKCTNSGGTWSGGKCKCSAEKNLRLSNGECVCTNENYKRSGDKCVLTDTAQEKKDCEAAASTGAYWQDGECKCENPQHEWRAKKCQLKADIAECNKITGAHWVNNECKCKNANQEINADKTACVATASFTATQTVNSAYSQLTAIHNKFRDNVSVWKDAEGNFNTARLASDTVAGVVLGTAGGLITSSVVKKNQVEDGFEDIKCTIGGQNVAGWGDQFRVGIQ